MSLNYGSKAILGILHQCPNIGKTALMKAIYLLQQVKKMNIGYQFGIYLYGPYAADVVEDIDRLIQAGLIDSIMSKYPSYVGYEMKLSQRGEEELGSLSEADIANISGIASFIKGKSVKNLELYSTIVFIRALYSDNKLPSTDNEIISKVHEIKPHFSIDLIREYCKELEEIGFI